MELQTDEVTGHAVVVMAPMGSGKGTLIRDALEVYPQLAITVSCTSRKKRPREIDGKHYHFITKDEFQAKIEAGDFLEWAEFASNYYGTLKSEIVPRLQNGQVVLLEIEVQGVEQLLKLIPRNHMTIIYIDAGGWEGLKARAIARAPITEEALNERYERYLVEREAKSLADEVIDNSGDVETAKQQFRKVIEEATNKCK